MPSSTEQTRIQTAARQYERALLAYVRRWLPHDPERARDVVQDAFLRLCEQTEPIEHLAPWLYAVCRRRAIDILRKESRMTELATTMDPPSTRHGPAEVAEVSDASRVILSYLAELPANQQEAVRLKFLQQFSYREIAQVMNTTESHVGVLLHTALKTLRNTIPGANQS
jgi:RNA polymerase sigma factor (sigma-70 family)